MRQDEKAREVGAAIDLAIRSTGLPRKDAAACLDLHESRVSRWCTGEAEQSLPRLLALPLPTRQTLLRKLCRDNGVVVIDPEMIETAGQFVQELLRPLLRSHQLKADLGSVGAVNTNKRGIA